MKQLHESVQTLRHFFEPLYQYLSPDISFRPPLSRRFPHTVCCREQEATCGSPLQTSPAFLVLSSWWFAYFSFRSGYISVRAGEVGLRAEGGVLEGWHEHQYSWGTVGRGAHRQRGKGQRAWGTAGEGVHGTDVQRVEVVWGPGQHAWGMAQAIGVLEGWWGGGAHEMVICMVSSWDIKHEGSMSDSLPLSPTHQKYRTRWPINKPLHMSGIST